MIEELKQRMLAKSAKVKRYEQRIEQFRQSRIFDSDQKNIYMELNRNGIRLNDVPNAESFGAILQVSEKCITEAEWLKDLKRDRERERQRENEHKC